MTGSTLEDRIEESEHVLVSYKLRLTSVGVRSWEISNLTSY